jgi:hypothetical protein
MRLVFIALVVVLLGACSQTATKKTGWSGPWVSPDTRTRVLFEDLIEEDSDVDVLDEGSEDDS